MTEITRLLSFMLLTLLAGEAYALDPGIYPVQCPSCQGCPSQPRCQPGIIWGQPGKCVPKHYATPFRNWMFGTQRWVPQGPPVPYRLQPGRIVFPKEVWPEQVWPKEVPPDVVYPRIAPAVPPPVVPDPTTPTTRWVPRSRDLPEPTNGPVWEGH